MARNGIVSVGFKDFERTVDRFEKHVIRKVKRIIAETAEMMVSQMKNLVAVDTGATKASIDVTYAQGGLTAIVLVGSEIGIYIEFGTGIYSSTGKGRKDPWVYFKDGKYYFTRGMKPQPFFYPSLEIAMKYFKNEMNKLS